MKSQKIILALVAIIAIGAFNQAYASGAAKFFIGLGATSFVSGAMAVGMCVQEKFFPVQQISEAGGKKDIARRLILQEEGIRTVDVNVSIESPATLQQVTKPGASLSTFIRATALVGTGLYLANRYGYLEKQKQLVKLAYARVKGFFTREQKTQNA